VAIVFVLTAAAEDLRFLGFVVRPSAIGYVARRSRRMARQIAAELRSEIQRYICGLPTATEYAVLSA
jgi:hypothetical protein